MKKFLSIKEFAEVSGVEISTLRYWEDIGLFSPAKRDPENNYRYYCSSQLVPLNFIIVLSGLEIPLKTIIELSNERNPEKILRLIEQQEKKLNAEMSRLRTSYEIILARRELISYGLKVNEGYMLVDGKRVDNGAAAADDGILIDDTKIAVMHRDDRPYILGPRNEYEEGETFTDALGKIVRQSKELRLNLSYPVGGYYESMKSILNAPSKPEHFFSMDLAGNSVREAGDYLVGFARGYYGELGDLPHRMAEYAEKNNIALSGPVYAMYLHDELCVKEPKKFLVQCCVAVSKRKQKQRRKNNTETQ